MSSANPLLLHDFFDQSVERWPARVAVDVPPGAGRPERRTVTYRQLARLKRFLAARVQPFITGESVVVILAERNSEHLYAAELAVLEAGAAYTCVDPAFPDHQLREILLDAQPAAVMADQTGRARLARIDATIPVIAICDAGFPGDTCPEVSRPAWLTPRSLAYIIYTSGTTGRPKGVMIEHGSVANLVAADRDEFGLTPADRVGQSSSAAYDSSVEEIWLAFAAGSTVVLMDDDVARMGPDLVPWLRREGLTVWCPPPTLLRATGCLNPETALPDLRLLYVGGEALPQDLADRWARGRRMVNGYGPTEVTVTSIRGEVRPGEPVSIGVPVRGLDARVVDQNLEQVASGDSGELCLSGAGLARGYRNKPELTQEKFPTHPQWGRLYRTGDLVHCDASGTFFYHGRVDGQVKIRGYRIELEAIEAKLVECPGVREAACRVQGEGSTQVVTAFIVPTRPEAPPSSAELESALAVSLPGYMIPARIGVLRELPKTVGGKLNRQALPVLEIQRRSVDLPPKPPRTAHESTIAGAFRTVLATGDVVSRDDDFFTDLGGDSLRAALLISALRGEAATAGLTVRDVYEARTPAGLAIRIPSVAASEIDQRSQIRSRVSSAQLLWSSIIQIAALIAFLVAGSALAFGMTYVVLPVLGTRLGLVPLILLAAPLAVVGLVLYAPLAVILVVIIKRVVIGRYRPSRAPVWGPFYLRHWIVRQCARLVPWRLLEGTEFQCITLRALGARIGRRVHIHRGVELSQGGWDLLDFGDDVTLSQDASVSPVELDGGELVMGTVQLEDGSTLDVRAGVGPDTCLEPGAYLTALSSLPRGGRVPRGERWDGVPATRNGAAPAVPRVEIGEAAMTPLAHGLATVFGQAVIWSVLALPIEAIAITAATISGVDAQTAIAWLAAPAMSFQLLVLAGGLLALTVPVTLAFAALISRAMGPVRPGAIGRWSLGYVRVWLKTGLLQLAGDWLSGTLFWPTWLRWAGMRVGRGCEISTIIDTVPELVEIGSETFLADGIYLGGPRVHCGVVTLAPLRLGQNVFLGNHVVIGSGNRVPDDVLLGVCTAAGDEPIVSGTSWFGHPPFALPRREVVEWDRRFTHAPPAIRYWNRVFWEALRFALPVVPLLTTLAWLTVVAFASPRLTPITVLFVAAPLATAGVAALHGLWILALKWVLLGRVRPGQHPLWSCWCSRWDFLYVAWGQHARGVLTALEGTPLLAWYLRAMGARIGKRVVLGAGFAQVVDPDMLQLDDEATVDCQFQAHTFEDRVLKIDRVIIGHHATVGNDAVLLYGADIGAWTYVAPHSVVMKRERLPPGRAYEGCPTRPKTIEPVRQDIGGRHV